MVQRGFLKLKPIKKTIKIEVEVTPSEYWKKTRDPDTDKLQRKSFSIKIAKAMIDKIELDLKNYAKDYLMDDEGEIVYDVCDRAEVDNYDNEHFNSLVAGIKIEGIDQFCDDCKGFKNV